MFHKIIKEVNIGNHGSAPVIIQMIDDDYARYCIQYKGSGFYCPNWKDVLYVLKQRKYRSEAWCEDYKIPDTVFGEVVCGTCDGCISKTAYWIRECDIKTGKYIGVRCSKCGNKESSRSPYCRMCGERMKIED